MWKELIYMKLFLDKECSTNDKETALLAILNGMYSNKYGHLSTSVSLIGYEMIGKFLKTSSRKERTIIDGIKDAIKSLVDKGIIEVINQHNDNYIFSGKGLEIDTNQKRFVVLEQWEMQNIFRLTNKPFNVFSFFCSLIGTVNNQTKEWHMSQDEMVAMWEYGKETVNDYLKQLEDMKLIYVYRHKKRRADGTYHKLNNSYGRYCDKDAIITEAQKYADSVECEDVFEKIDRRAIKLRYNAYCKGAKKYINNPAAVIDLYRQCLAYNKSLKTKPVEYSCDGEYKQGEPLDLSVFPDHVGDGVDDNWGEPDSMEQCHTEEIFDMPGNNEDQSERVNSSGTGQNNGYKQVSTLICVQPRVGKLKESDYIESNTFTLNETHGRKVDRKCFCTTEKDLDLINIDDLF